MGAEKKISFNEQVRPILSEKCYYCHGPDAEDIKGKVQLHTFENVTNERTYTRRGKTKTLEPVIIPGDPENSLLFQLVTTDDEDDIMPPKKRHMPVTKDEIEVLRQWIKEGAEYEELWSLKPLPKEVAVPAVDSSKVKNEIDHFVQNQLKEEKLAPAEVAADDVLLRRVYLSLSGLVPTPQQIVDFKADKSGKAYENVVDKLLASKAYAEHVAVDWMDAARYADSYGYQTDRGRHVWPWRDWVLKAFDQNLSYDQFIHQQLAGDLMPESDDQMKLATAFNRLHMQKNEGGSVPEEFRTEYVADRAQTAATAFLGLTMECCRCHDHKYDPISQEDYFKTFALFNNIDEAGLYSFFTQAVPSPSMPVLKENEKLELAKKADALKKAEQAVVQVRDGELANFEAWRKTWDKKVEIKGEIAHFSFDDVKKTKILNSLTGKETGNFNAQYTQVVEAKKGKGLITDGDSDIVIGEIGPYERHHEFSFSLWLKVPESYKRAIVMHRSKAWNDAASRGYELLVEDGKVSFALVHFHPGNEIRVRAKNNLKINDWQQVSVSYDGSSKAAGIKLYLNGEAIVTDIIKDNLTKEIYYKDPTKVKAPQKADAKGKKNQRKKPNPDLIIGARMRDNGLKNGLVDELRFFDRKLSALEFSELFNSKNGDSQDELFDYYLENQSQQYNEAVAQVSEKRADYNRYYDKRFHMMIMKEQEVQRKTYVLKRGLYSTPDLEREVEPGPPEKVFPFGPEYSRDRLGFAKWLTHPQHPLTARVTVNRYWQMIFGRGLVGTTNDFGSQGEFPSHPELLDYLSRRFIDSGWDLKALLKSMVMSHTFRQSSKTPTTLLERDPDNKLLARGPANHMTAEMLRDNALFTGGLIVDQFGGQSIQSKNTWKNKYRRSLYTYWKRNDPTPEMLIFGTPRRQVCSVKREKTSTPLQPLVLMNSPLVTESAKSAAVNLLKTEADDVSRLKAVYQQLTSSELTKDQIEILQTLLNEQRAYFATNKEVAKKLTDIGKTKIILDKLDRSELASWTVIANAIINLDSFYMVR